MEIFFGVLLILSFFGLAVYAVKGGNLLMGMLIMATLWTVIPLIGNIICVTWPNLVVTDYFKTHYIDNKDTIIHMGFLDALVKTYQKGAEGWGATLVNVVFGAWFGRVILKTGIAETLIKKTTELGGDKPAVTAILLSIVTCCLFFSLMGAGAVVAIGVIVLPILISLGIPKIAALASFVISVGAGMFINPVLNSQYTGMMPTWQITNNYAWGFAMAGIQLVFTFGLIFFYTRRKRLSSSWAALEIPEVPERKKLEFAPSYALISPLIPVVLNLLGVPIILGFLVGGFYASIVCGTFKGFAGACRQLNRDFFEGVVDVAPLLGFLLCLAMFNASANFVSPYFDVCLHDVLPTNSLLLVIVLMCLAPLAMFRGPLTLFGCGIAILNVLTAQGSIPMAIIAPTFIILTTVMNVSVCMTQSWIAWGIGYTKVKGKDFLLNGLIMGYLITITMCMVTYFGFFQGGLINA